MSPISGINNNAFVDADGIENGFDNESEDSYRSRINYIYANPVSQFNISQVTLAAQSIYGVTRVWVFPTTPITGQSTVYFTRDNDISPIPDVSEITEVKNAILPLQPIESDSGDLFVLAPIPVFVNFTFASLDPNTPEMFNAVKANLEQLFRDTPNVGETLVADAYRSVIYQTIDPVSGQYLKSFSLNAPIGNINITTGQLALLGTVTAP